MYLVLYHALRRLEGSQCLKQDPPHPPPPPSPATNNTLKFLPGAHTTHNLSFPECVNEEFFPGTHIRGGTTPSLGDAKLCSERPRFYNPEGANDPLRDDSEGRTTTITTPTTITTTTLPWDTTIMPPGPATPILCFTTLFFPGLSENTSGILHCIPSSSFFFSHSEPHKAKSEARSSWRVHQSGAYIHRFIHLTSPRPPRKN
ncbi:hypothetical protein E2C01_002015 [Portunus trituberculatus]|uniref:Uncharacterized protein n=1 Tax=Portunus trituberculatus TaxID=210409 RepID=A0A5B7CKZ9_PORTR|nr:hypothetical protein [Portunus trituberculatus]